MKTAQKLMTLAAFVAFGFAANAQDATTDAHDVTVVIPGFAILDIEPSGGNDITLTAAAPTEAGDALDLSGATDATLWLNYSALLNATGAGSTSRKITVALNNATPAGYDLTLTAGAVANGQGTTGTPSATLTLSATAQDLVTAIGSAYTTTGVNNGHNLTYSLIAATPGSLVATTGVDYTVTYTFVDNP